MKQYRDSLSVSTPLVCSHTDTFACFFTTGDRNNPLGSMHGRKRESHPWPLNIAGSSFDLFSVAFRQYKYIGSSTVEYTLQPIGSQKGDTSLLPLSYRACLWKGTLHFSPYLPEHVCYTCKSSQQQKAYRPLGARRCWTATLQSGSSAPSNSKGTIYWRTKGRQRDRHALLCDDHEFTVVSHMRPLSAPHSF